MKRRAYTLKSKGRSIALGEETLVMGILNVTPDSFSDGGDFTAVENAIQQAKKYIADGVHIIDIGGESTRPGATEVAENEELSRVIPVIKAIRDFSDVLISIDTYKARVAEEAVLAGADIINDVWGMQKEPRIASVAVKHNVPVVAMHNQTTNVYHEDIIIAMQNFFEKSFEIAKDAGLETSQIVLDPGIGFGKDADQNIVVLARLSEVMGFGFPVLLGTSRKSMIGKILDLPPRERVEGTIASNMYGITLGVEIIRVHDVLEHVRASKVMDVILKGKIDG